MERPFRAGQCGTVGGVEYRIVNGKKHSRRRSGSDLRIDLRAPNWVPVGMPLLMLLTDFLCDNEDYLYPPEQGFRGGKMLMDYLDAARLVGWEAAAERLAEDRARKRAA